MAYRKVNLDTCIKNLMWELFELSQNLSGCGRVKFAARQERFNNDFKYRTFSLNLVKDLFTIKVRTRIQNAIPELLVSFEKSLKKDKDQYDGGLNTDKINESIKDIVDEINQADKIPQTKTYTLSPATLDEDLSGLSYELKNTLMKFLFPKFADYLETYIGTEDVEGFAGYKRIKDTFSSVNERMKEQQDTDPKATHMDDVLHPPTVCLVSS